MYSLFILKIKFISVSTMKDNEIRRIPGQISKKIINFGYPPKNSGVAGAIPEPKCVRHLLLFSYHICNVHGTS